MDAGMRLPVRMRSVASLTSLAVGIYLVPLLASSSSFADDSSAPNVASAASPGQKGDDSKPAWAGDLDTRADLLGDLGGIRSAFDRYGLSFGLTETTESLGNPNGGARQGTIVEGMTQMSVGLDLSKTFGLDGGIVNVSAFQIHGRGLSSRNLDNLNIASSIEADPATRLNELWFQQSFLDGKVDVKIGQQSADLEFITSEYEDLFINSGFGWPTLPAIDLPSGGPAYPLPTPGIRLRAKPTDDITALIGLFNGAPAGLQSGDPQKNDPSGTNFDVSSGALVMSELQYAVSQDKDAKGLPGTYKLGAWYNTNRFADPFFSNSVLPTSTVPARRGDWSIYGTFDQLIYRPKDNQGGVGLTARAMAAPGDRNVVDFFLQSGVIYKGPFDRNNDSVGLAAEFAHISPKAQAGDAAAAATSGAFFPVRHSETVIEATYQAQIKPWWQLQPDLQYVLNPGAGVANPYRPSKRIGDAAVLGLRSVVTF